MSSEISIYKSLLEGYDKGAAYFSETRCFFWRDLQFIKEYIRKNDKILDFGCGNGRLLELTGSDFKEYLGVDISEKLIEIAKNKYGENTPGKTQSRVAFKKIHPYKFILPSAYFDAVCSIGVFHHLPSGAIRNSIRAKLWDALKPGGHIIVSVWNLHQERYQNYFIGDGQETNEGYIPFKDQQGNILFDRYHYRWNLPELESFFTNAGFEIVQSGKTERNNHPANLFVIGKKPVK